MIGSLYLETGQENAACKFYQLFNRELRAAVPATLLKVSHAKLQMAGFNANYLPLVKYYKQNPYMERIIQSTILSEGVLLQIAMEMQVVFNTWLATHSKVALAKLLRNSEDPDCLASLKASSGLDSEAQNTIPQYLDAIKKLIQNYTPEKAIAEIPNLFDQLDHYSFCAFILANIIMNATDMKADNIMLRWRDSPNSRKFYFESVDSDQAFSPPITRTKKGHYITLRCILLFFKNMNITFDEKLADELLEHPAIYYLLSWIQLVYEDEQRFEESVQQKIFTENDLFEEGTQALDRPLKFHQDTLPRMLHLLQKAQQILSVKKNIRLDEFFQKLSPACALYYQQIATQHPDSPFDEYHQLNNGATVEELCPVTITDKHLKQSIHKDEAYNKTLTCKEAIAALIANYSDGEKLDKQFKLLEYIGEYFPFIKELKLDIKQINALLVSLPEFMLPNALDLLLRCGGDVNCRDKNNETLLFRILAREDLGNNLHRERLIRSLLTHTAIDVHAVGQNGITLLMAFIHNAKAYSLEFIKFVLDLFAAKHTDLNQMTPSGTALDIAVQLQSKQLFTLLVNQGCSN